MPTAVRPPVSLSTTGKARSTIQGAPLGSDELRKTEAKRDAVPADQQAIAATWQTWLAKQHTTGNGARPDVAHPEQMNRYTWYQTHHWKVPYPGDSKIYAPSQVPGGEIPNSDSY